ncbi:MAG: sulfatase [Verrucomicrobiales bacterium]|nr:MAG: sulfatase [Verrucomicrobiales bacterium]
MQLSPQKIVTLINRRSFLSRTSLGLGATALASLAKPDWLSAASGPNSIGGLPGLPHLAAKAKRVIFLCMAGGPSHLETFDYKPELARLDGQPMPESFTKGQPIAQLQNTKLKCLGPLFPFRRHGQSGQQISDMLPGIAGIADDIAIVRSMHTDQINHDPAHTVMNTGTSISGRPSMGAWVTYGLGSLNEDLPGFVVLTSEGGRNPQPISSRQWGAGFLPSRHQGVQFFSQGDPVHYVRSAPGVNREQQRGLVETLGKLNRLRNERVANPEIDTRIAQYELAFRMQASVPELMDFSGEPQHVLDAYGVKGMDGSFAANCLLARRLAERGTRFIHLYHRGWDHHGDLERYMKICCGLCDHPSAALVKDLKARGMLDDTLVIWGGEFGRTNYCQGTLGKDNFGRDHHGRCFSLWMAGGGAKGGTVVGQTDDYGYNIVKDGVHVHDFHATLLHLLGIDHERLTFKYQGRYFRLTDVHGHVVKGALA